MYNIAETAISALAQQNSYGTYIGTYIRVIFILSSHKYVIDIIKKKELGLLWVNVPQEYLVFTISFL